MHKIDDVNKNDISIIDTKFKELDNLHFNIESGNLITIAGLSEVGLSAFICNLALNIAEVFEGDNKCNVGIISLSRYEYAIQNEISSIAQHQQKTAFNKAIWIDTLASETLDAFIEECAEDIRDHDLDVLFIDDIYLLTDIQNDRNNDLNLITKRLKQLALNWNVTIVITQKCLLRKNTRIDQSFKSLSFLEIIHESAFIHNSDKVIKLFSTDQLGITEDIYGNSLIGMTFVEIAKNNTGKKGIVNLRFIRDIPIFESFPEEEPGTYPDPPFIGKAEYLF